MVVLDRDTPVAQIVPLTTADVVPDDDRARLDRLARRGLVRRGRGGSMGWLLKHEPLKIRGSVLKDLFEERESGW